MGEFRPFQSGASNDATRRTGIGTPPVGVAPNGARVSTPAGGVVTPDATGTDTKGCANALAMDRSAPGGATMYNTNYVRVMPDDRATGSPHA